MGECRRSNDGTPLDIDELVSITGTIGKIWRRHRRRKWPHGLKDTLATLLLELRVAIAPSLEKDVVAQVWESPGDVRGLVQFLAAVAQRKSPGEVCCDTTLGKGSGKGKGNVNKTVSFNENVEVKLIDDPEIDNQIENLKLSMKSEMEDLRRSLKKEMLNSLAESREQMKINFMSALGHMFSTSSSADGQSDVGQDAETEDMLSLEPAEHG